MKYAMAIACLGTLLLSTSALAGSAHGQKATSTTVAFNSHDSHANGGDRGDQDRDEMVGLLDKEVNGIVHNPHCDPDDQNGPDGDKDDHAANNPGRGRHVGRCHNLGHPASP